MYTLVVPENCLAWYVLNVPESWYKCHCEKITRQKQKQQNLHNLGTLTKKSEGPSKRGTQEKNYLIIKVENTLEKVKAPSLQI